MRYGYVTKRQAPIGYSAVTRPLAAHLYEQGKSVTMAGNYVNSYNIFNDWYLGFTCHISSGQNFEYIVHAFLFAFDSELGRYPVFYVRKEDL